MWLATCTKCTIKSGKKIGPITAVCLWKQPTGGEPKVECHYKLSHPAPGTGREIGCFSSTRRQTRPEHTQRGICTKRKRVQMLGNQRKQQRMCGLKLTTTASLHSAVHDPLESSKSSPGYTSGRSQLSSSSLTKTTDCSRLNAQADKRVQLLSIKRH